LFRALWWSRSFFFFSSALLCCSFPSDTVEISLVRISGRIDQWLYDDDDVICW
jgi:hypothetical protein